MNSVNSGQLRMREQLVVEGTADVRSQLLVEEFFQLQRATPPRRIIRIERRLRPALLDRRDDSRRIADRPSVDREHGHRRSITSQTLRLPVRAGAGEALARTRNPEVSPKGRDFCSLAEREPRSPNPTVLTHPDRTNSEREHRVRRLGLDTRAHRPKQQHGRARAPLPLSSSSVTALASLDRAQQITPI